MSRLMRGILASSAVAADPYWSQVSSLLRFDGADGTTTFSDETGKVWTAAGSAQLDTSQSRFGGSSLLLDGNGDYITTAAHADFGFGTGDFTVEGWHRATGWNNNAFLADFRVLGGASFVIWCSENSHAGRFAYSTEMGTAYVSGPGVFTFGVWKHWAVTRQAGTVRGFLDGVLQFTTTDARDFGSIQGPYIGSSVSANQGAIGNMDLVRTTKGLARYTTDFTPPIVPFGGP